MLKKINIVVAVLLLSSAIFANDSLTEPEEGVIKGCAIGISLKYGKLSELQMQNICMQCIKNVNSFEKNKISFGTKECVEVVRSLQK